MSNHNLSATDFVYAIVAGAAFQRITSPDFSVNSLAVVFALFVLIDDWVLFHARAKTVYANEYFSPMHLFIDLSVLLVWYWVTLFASQTPLPSGAYLATLAVFFAITGFTEYPLHGFQSRAGMLGQQLNHRARRTADYACSASALLGGILFLSGVFVRELWLCPFMLAIAVMRLWGLRSYFRL